MIQITAGEKSFLISETNLKKSEYFNSYLTRWNKEDDIIIDEDPRLFRHFLNCLRHDTYQIPEKYRENVWDLLDYYGVKYTRLDPTPAFIWIFEKRVFNDATNIKFEFKGKLAGIAFYDPNYRYFMEIMFNGTKIFSEKLWDYHLKINSKIYRSLNTKLINNFNELEGMFIINIKGTRIRSSNKCNDEVDEGSGASILYLVKREISKTQID